jgi:predicted TIM-barrel fold metal-dependent hydrolase
MAQIFLNDIDEAIAEVERIRSAGLTGGVLLPIVYPGDVLPPLYSPEYNRLYAACADMNVPLTQHATSTGEPSDVGMAIAYTELAFFSNRGLWHMILGGVFERHPFLTYVVTEQFCGWIPARLNMLDGMYDQSREEGTVARKFCGPALDTLSKRPSEYWKRNCYVATFMLPAEVAVRDQIGVDRMMWGSDYPHAEGTTPWTLEALRACYASLTVEETSAIVGETAAQVYGLDLPVLREAAERIGPLVSSVHVPLEKWPAYPGDTQCQTFADPTGSGSVARGRALYPSN